jgi:hypothetical protein
MASSAQKLSFSFWLSAICALALGLAADGAAGADELDDVLVVVRKVHKAFDESANILASVTDETTAKKSLDKLLAIEKKYDTHTNLIIYQDMFHRDRMWCREKIERHEQIWEKCQSEYDRLYKLPGAFAVVRDTVIVGYHEHLFTKLSKRLIDVNLTEALERFRAVHSTLLDKLNELVKSIDPKTSKSFLRADLLTDQWDQPFEYDPKGPKNNAERPDIWSLGPPYRTGDKYMIANWLSEKKRSER